MLLKINREYYAMRFFFVDGKIVEKKDILLSEDFTDVQFRLSQKMWYGYGGIPLFAENINLLESQAAALNIKFPKEFQNKRELYRLIKRMLNKNKLYRSGHVHLQIISGIHAIHTLATCTSFTEFIFPFSDDGLLVNFSRHKKYSLNALNRLPFFGEWLWQLVLAEVQDTQFHQSVILNEKDLVCESAYNNLFIIANNELTTPSFLSGCHENTLRHEVLEASKKLGLKVAEKSSITANDLMSADELFFASESSGIQWILGIENQRFIHYYSRIIHDELNVLLKGKAILNPL